MTARMARRRPSHVASRRPISRARDGIFCGGRRSPLVVAPAGADPPRPEALEDELVRRHRQENEDPEDGVLQERAAYWPAQEALLEQVDERRAEKRSHHRARAAEDIHAADHDGRDGLELEPLAGDDGDVPEAHQEKETGEAGEGPAEQEGHEDVALDREPGNAGGLWIGADREEPPAIGQVLQDELEHDDHQGGEHDERPHIEVAEGKKRSPREVEEPLWKRIGRDGLRARELDERDAVDRERAERRDDGRDAPEGDDRAVDCAERAAERDREGEGEGRRQTGVVGEERPHEICDQPDDRADREVDVPGQDDERLADSDDGDDLETGADVGERPSREVVGDLGRKERSDGNEDEHERELADLLRPDAAEQPCHAVPAGASVCPIAAANTRSWVASALAKTATCRPSRMTRMRSLIARTSGSSELIRMMARPSWASSSMI